MWTTVASPLAVLLAIVFHTQVPHSPVAEARSSPEQATICQTAVHRVNSRTTIYEHKVRLRKSEWRLADSCEEPGRIAQILEAVMYHCFMDDILDENNLEAHSIASSTDGRYCDVAFDGEADSLCVQTAVNCLRPKGTEEIQCVCLGCVAS